MRENKKEKREAEKESGIAKDRCRRRRKKRYGHRLRDREEELRIVSPCRVIRTTSCIHAPPFALE